MPGDHRGVVTPDPIPNSEVKHSFADDTAGETLWKSRSSPGFFYSFVLLLHIYTKTSYHNILLYISFYFIKLTYILIQLILIYFI